MIGRRQSNGYLIDRAPNHSWPFDDAPISRALAGSPTNPRKTIQDRCMEGNIDPLCILLADDDPDDRMLTERALKKSRLANQLEMVEDGEELMQYLRREGPYMEPHSAPRPGLILLDLNMPRKDGREALREIKSDAVLRRIPVIVLTTSEAEQDILRSYDLGVNAFVTKPVTFDGLATAIQRMSDFWFDIVKLPRDS